MKGIRLLTLLRMPFKAERRQASRSGATTPALYFSPELRQIAERLEPGKFLHITRDGGDREFALLDMADFEHICELSGLRHKSDPSPDDTGPASRRKRAP